MKSNRLRMNKNSKVEKQSLLQGRVRPAQTRGPPLSYKSPTTVRATWSQHLLLRCSLFPRTPSTGWAPGRGRTNICAEKNEIISYTSDPFLI